MRWSGARTRHRAGGEQGGSTGSDRIGTRAVMSSLDVLIDRGVADRGFAAAACGRCQDALTCDRARATSSWR